MGYLKSENPHLFLFVCLLGATVLFLNATDLDRSREYGQESIIFSLEGSSHFRINARSGEHRHSHKIVPFLFHVSSLIAAFIVASFFPSASFLLVFHTDFYHLRKEQRKC